MAPTSILESLLEHADAEPGRPCVVWDATTISYGELAAAAGAWAGSYAALGVGRGERVALYLGSGPGFLGAYLGAHAAGAAVVLVNTQYRQVELRHILADSEPRAVVADGEGVARLAELGDAGYAVVEADPARLDAPAASAEARPLLPEAGDLAILAYTSGTTGRSKGAMLTHGALAANSAAVRAAWRWSAEDRLLLVLPLFHIHGLGVGVHGTLAAGASMRLRPRFDPAETLVDLASGACTMFFGVPTIYTRLIQEAERIASGPQPSALSPQPSQVRLFVSGSAPLSPQTFADFAARFGQPILERYGMTETGMNLTNPYAGERRPGTVGAPFPGQEARIVGVKSRAPLPDGEIGEIQVRGPHVFAGYWRNQAATAEVLAPDGWFSTGDLGWRSPDGYYTITGRARELIISGGYNIYPREVEEVLLEHPAVAECAVLGLPDPDFGERVAAVVVPRDAAAAPTPAELDAFCRERLAAYKRPRELQYVASLPRNAMGKVQKHELKAHLAAAPRQIAATEAGGDAHDPGPP